MDHLGPGLGTNSYDFESFTADVICPCSPPFSPATETFDGIYLAPLMDVPAENIKSGCSTFSEGSAKIVLFKFNPNFLQIEEKPFDPEIFVEEVNPAMPTIRYRLVQNPDGTTSIESNARIVKWSDGSKQLLVGDKAFDLIDDIPRKLMRGVTFSQEPGKAGGWQTSIAEDAKGKSVQTKQEQEDLPTRQEQVELPTRQELGDLLTRVKQFHLHVRQALVRQEQVDFRTRKENVNSRTTQEHVDLHGRQDVDLHTRQDHANLEMGQVQASVQPQGPGIDEGEDENGSVTDEGEDESDPEIDEWEYESDPEEDPDYMEDQYC